MTRYIVAGCGSMARRRVRHALAAGAEAVGVWDIRSDRMDEMQTLHPEVVRLADLGSFDAFRPDALFVCVPPSDHERYLDWAVAHGIAFMVEQPVSDHPANMARLLAAVEARRIVTHVSGNQRYFEPIQALKRVIDDGELGAVRAVIAERGEYLPDWHPYEPYRDYYPSHRARGGGMDAICDLEWIRYLFGDVTAARAMAQRKSGLDIDTDDCVDFALEMRSGPQVALHCDMLQRLYAFRVKLVCAEGTVVYDAPETCLKIFSVATGEWTERPFATGFSDHGAMQGKPYFAWVEPMYQADSQSFLDRLARRDPDTASLRFGIENLRIVHELIRGSGRIDP